MKKLLSALLIATLLIASVACVLAVAEEDGNTNPIVFNFLSEVKNADTEDATVVVNEDGSVTITVKNDIVDKTNPVVLVESYENGTVDFTSGVYLVVSFETTGSETDFLAHYTRSDKTADNYFTGAVANADNVVSSTSTSVIWNITAYLGDRALANGAYLDFALVNAKAGDVITIHTYAVSTEPAFPTPDDDDTTTDGGDDTTSTEDDTTTDGGDDTTSTEDDTTTSEAPAASSEAPAASSEAPAASSDAPITGDTGMIVFAVLAVVALAGGFIVVRARG